VAKRPMVMFHDSWLAGNAGLNSARGIDVSCVCCRIEVSASGRSPVQGIFTDSMCITACDLVSQKSGGPGQRRAATPDKKKNKEEKVSPTALT
jgi:hypothetical protein